MNLIVLFFWFAAFVAILFLIYSIMNHKKMNLTWHHPRILGEIFLLIVLLLMGWVFLS